ncbi:MAG: Dabb family protein [Alphaproteobacteria bacterium]|nr:Dabb family protein [Alphaproteobacteria bacterium]
MRHIVLCKFKASIDEAERQEIFAGLASLRGHLSGITDMSFGRSVSPEGLEQGFMHGFTIDFADAAARDAYLADEGHKKAGARFVAALEGGFDGLVVCDIEI